MIEELAIALFGALKSRARPSLAGLGLHLAAGLLMLLAGLYLSYALFLGLEERLGPPWAGALTGFVLLLLAGLCLLFALLGRRPSRRDKSEPGDLTEAVLNVGELIAQKLEVPGSAIAISALLAGVAAGISPAARGFLLNFIETLFKDIKGEPK